MRRCPSRITWERDASHMDDNRAANQIKAKSSSAGSRSEDATLRLKTG